MVCLVVLWLLNFASSYYSSHVSCTVKNEVCGPNGVRNHRADIRYLPSPQGSIADICPVGTLIYVIGELQVHLILPLQLASYIT